MDHIAKADLYRWCKIPRDELAGHPLLRVRFRMVRDSAAMGQLMAEDLCQVIEANNKNGAPTRAIIPCGPSCWYGPFTNLVNTRNLSARFRETNSWVIRFFGRSFAWCAIPPRWGS